MTSALALAGAHPLRTFGDPALHADGDLLLVAFAKDGSLTSLEEPGILRRWSIAGKNLANVVLSDLETQWAVSRDADFLASGSDDLTLWDAAGGHVLASLAQSSWVTALAIGPDAAFVASGHDDGAVCFWDLAAHNALHTLRHHDAPISALAFRPDGRVLAAASEDKSITLWDVVEGERLAVFTGHTDRVPGLLWHPTRPLLVSLGWDATARVWDTETLQPVVLLNAHATQVTAAAFSPCGRQLAVADADRQILVWDFDARKVVRTLTGLGAEVRSLAYSPDGKTLAATGDRVIHLWDAETSAVVGNSGCTVHAVPAVVVRPDGSTIATNGGGRGGRTWSVSDGAVGFALDDLEELHQLAWSADGSRLIGACGSHVRVWNADGTKAYDADGPDEPMTLVAAAPDGQAFATAHLQGTSVWVWDAAAGEPALLIPDPLDGCALRALVYHPSRRILAVGGIDWLATGGSTGALSLWNLDERAETATIGEGVTAVAFHPSGARVVAATLDAIVGVYDGETLDLIRECGHTDDAIACLAYSPDGALVVAGCDDQTLRVWTEEGEEWGVVEVDSRVTALAFSPCGRTLYAAHANTTCSQYAVADLRAE